MERAVSALQGKFDIGKFAFMEKQIWDPIPRGAITPDGRSHAQIMAAAPSREFHSLNRPTKAMIENLLSPPKSGRTPEATVQMAFNTLFRILAAVLGDNSQVQILDTSRSRAKYFDQNMLPDYSAIAVDGQFYPVRIKSTIIC